MEIDLPERLSAERFDRVLTLLVGVAAVVAALLVAFELSSSRRSARADAEASRIAVSSLQVLTSTSVVSQFKLASLIQVEDHLTEAQVASVVSAEGDARAFLAAEERAAGLQADATERTIGVPVGGDVVKIHAALLAQAQRDAAAFATQVNRSSALVDASDRYGRRDSRATFALTLLASAGALFGLAGVLRAGRAGWVSLGTGTAGLAAAAAVGVSALLL
jgi:hypothetical protein